VWRKHEQPALSDVAEILNGIGRMLQEIDAKLQRIVSLLEEDE
jgi:hypothetical protein